MVFSFSLDDLREIANSPAYEGMDLYDIDQIRRQQKSQQQETMGPNDLLYQEKNRKNQQLAEELLGLSKGNAGEKLLYNVMSGIDQLTSTLNNLKPGTKQPPSASQYASAQLREERKEEENPLEKGLYKFNDIQNRQVGSKIAESISGNPVLEGLYAVTSGMGQYAEDLNSLRYTTAQPPTANAYAAGEIRSNINWGPEIIKGQNLGQSLFDLGQTTGRLLPSILLSKAMGATQGLTIPDEELSLVKDAILKSSQKAGSLVTGVSSMGGARAQALRDGYSAGEALVYGAVNGVLEGGLEYALGGISTLGKGGTSKALSKLPVLQKLKEMLPQAIKSPAMQKALKTTGSYIARMGDEGFEEYLQAVIDPMVRNLILKEDNELDLLSDDALYAAFLGALTAGILNLPSAMTGRMSGGNAENQSLQNPLENGRMGIEGSGENGGIQTAQELRGGYSDVYGETGGQQRTGADDGGRETGFSRITEESRESFERRTSSNFAQQQIDQHGDSVIAYIPAQQVASNSEAGKVASGLSGLGVQVIVTEGSFETNRNGLTTLHTDAVTAPDGTVYVSNQTKIPAEQIVSHEGLHVLQRQMHPAYDTFYEIFISNVDWNSETYSNVFKSINDSHFEGKLSLKNIDDATKIFRELTAYIHQFVNADPAFARETFSGMFRNWSAVVKASQALNTVIAGQNTSVQTASIKPLSAEVVVNTEKGKSQQTTVQGIAKVTDGEVEVKLREGKTAPLVDVEFTNPTLGSLYEAAGNYVTGTAKAFVAGYDGSLPLTQYQAAFELIHNQAVKGVAMDAAVEAAGDVGQQLSNSARKLAYNSGIRDSHVLHSPADNGRIETENVMSPTMDNSALVDMDDDTHLEKDDKYPLYRRKANTTEFSKLKEPMTIEHVRKICQDSGMDYSGVKLIIIDDAELIRSDFLGYTHPGGSTVELYPNAFKNRETLVKTLGHEFVHVMQNKLYGPPQDTITGSLFEKEAVQAEEICWENYKKQRGGY